MFRHRRDGKADDLCRRARRHAIRYAGGQTIVRDSARTDYRFASLILSVVKSEPFQMRTKDK